MELVMKDISKSFKVKKSSRSHFTYIKQWNSCVTWRKWQWENNTDTYDLRVITK